MTTKQMKNAIAKGLQLIARVSQRAGLYLCEKVSDELTVLQKQGDEWLVCNDITDNTLQTIALAKVKDVATGKLITIAVDGDYFDWANGTVFAVKIDSKGRSTLNLTPLDPDKVKQTIKQLKKEEVPA